METRNYLSAINTKGAAYAALAVVVGLTSPTLASGMDRRSGLAKKRCYQRAASFDDRGIIYPLSVDVQQKRLVFEIDTERWFKIPADKRRGIVKDVNCFFGGKEKVVPYDPKSRKIVEEGH